MSGWSFICLDDPIFVWMILYMSWWSYICLDNPNLYGWYCICLDDSNLSRWWLFVWIILYFSIWSCMFLGDPNLSEWSYTCLDDSHMPVWSLIVWKILICLDNPNMPPWRVVVLNLTTGELFLDVDNGRNDALQETPTQHYTFIFNVFVFMTMFNEINARKINGSLNVFAGLQTSYIFIVLWTLTVSLQVCTLLFRIN